MALSLVVLAFGATLTIGVLADLDPRIALAVGGGSVYAAVAVRGLGAVFAGWVIAFFIPF